jgi:hypothetical protein
MRRAIARGTQLQIQWPNHQLTGVVMRCRRDEFEYLVGIRCHSQPTEPQDSQAQEPEPPPAGDILPPTEAAAAPDSGLG